MLSFLRKWKYRADVNARIDELFAGMPEEYLPAAKRMVNLKAAIDRNFELGTATKESAIKCAAFLMAVPIQGMDQGTRNDLLRQYENDEPSAFNIGLNMLLATAMKYTDKLEVTRHFAVIDALGSEIFGALHGMSREEKQRWMQQLAVEKLNGRGRLPPWASGKHQPPPGREKGQPANNDMSKRWQYAQAKRLLNEIRHELDTAPLTPQQRNELERNAAALAGFLLHPWFPESWGRRLVMVGIVCLGLQQAWVGNYEPLIFWLLLPLFSPRIMGECFHLFGRIRS